MNKQNGNRKPVSQEEKDSIVADYKDGAPIDDIAAKHKRNKSTVFGVVQRSGATMRGKGWAGNKNKKRVKNGSKVKRHEHGNNGRSISEAERGRMAADYAVGMTQAEMVKKYERSPDAIRHAATLAGVPLRGRGHRGKDVAMKMTKKSMRAKMKKKAKRAAVAVSINHANKALTKAHKSGDTVARAVGVLIKSLETEEIQELFIDFNRREYKTTRLRVEEGRVV
jgi:hypothetical protein